MRGYFGIDISHGSGTYYVRVSTRAEVPGDIKPLSKYLALWPRPWGYCLDDNDDVKVQNSHELLKRINDLYPGSPFINTKICNAPQCMSTRDDKASLKCFTWFAYDLDGLFDKRIPYYSDYRYYGVASPVLDPKLVGKLFHVGDILIPENEFDIRGKAVEQYTYKVGVGGSIPYFKNLMASNGYQVLD